MLSYNSEVDEGIYADIKFFYLLVKNYNVAVFIMVLYSAFAIFYHQHDMIFYLSIVSTSIFLFLLLVSALTYRLYTDKNSDYFASYSGFYYGTSKADARDPSSIHTLCLLFNLILIFSTSFMLIFNHNHNYDNDGYINYVVFIVLFLFYSLTINIALHRKVQALKSMI